ncbi:hypothetical protein LEL_04506 [Akanthomyces lecanii RCEF 1005]|uniref:Uncharacterized protein n=1 Tax=Akanthomyces lecanii RCEF 1005 TaxID=1081108 RepID=A0A162K6M1_CORDF|nr:hypothetical protein LEL_04506 [Akanthomyces lecanii RCEF 1005]
MASSNPFRKSVLQPKVADSTLPPLDPIDTTQTHDAPPRTSFRAPEPSDANDEPQPVRKQKPMKKVRVLTPPPLSPDSPEWPEVEPMYRTGAGLVPPPVDYDPFGGSATDESDRDSTVTPPYQRPAAGGFAAAPPAPGGPPGNPFSRTLQDMEDTANKEELDLQQREEGEVLKAANADTPALNVDAFKRLLLTGNSGLQGSQQSADDQGLASVNAEANKIVAAPDSAPEDSQANSDKGSPKQDQRVASPSASNKDKKLVPPPPPSSRHGKTIKGEQTKPTQSESEHQHVLLETKPTPHIPSVDGIESASDEDSSTDSPPPEAATPTSAKKPAPAPPPRRGHARSDTRSNLSPLKPADDESESRSSLDSTHRQDAGGGEKPRAQIPVPPPPRRPHVAPKQSNSTGPSPSVSSSSIPQRNQAETSAVSPNPTSKLGKSPAPPRPPARNPSSARRPLGPGGATLERRDSMPPPPPPPRHRGSSSPTRKTSADRPDVDSSKGADILADLDALRREVEALRGGR